MLLPFFASVTLELSMTIGASISSSSEEFTSSIVSITFSDEKLSLARGFLTFFGASDGGADLKHKLPFLNGDASCKFVSATDISEFVFEKT